MSRSPCFMPICNTHPVCNCNRAQVGCSGPARAHCDQLRPDNLLRTGPMSTSTQECVWHPQLLESLVTSLTLPITAVLGTLPITAVCGMRHLAFHTTGAQNTIGKPSVFLIFFFYIHVWILTWWSLKQKKKSWGLSSNYITFERQNYHDSPKMMQD